MIIKPNKNLCKDFLQFVYDYADEGYLAIWTKQNKKTISFNLNENKAIEKASNASAVLASKKNDVYFTCGLLNKMPYTGRGKERDVIGIPGLWMDIDTNNGVHAKKELPSPDEAVQFLNDFPLKHSIMVNSGGGFHVYWLFKEIWYFDNEDERKKARSLSNQFQKTIILKANDKFGWNLDLTDDLVRLLRIPGTINYKGNPKNINIFSQNDHRYNSFDFEPYLIEDTSNQSIINQKHDAEKKQKKYEFNPVLHNLLEYYAFLKHCKGDAKTLPQPDWYCMISCLCFEGGARPFIHELSKPYPKYSEHETEKMLRNAQDKQTGPMLCSTIQSKTGFKCPKNCGVKTPVSLKKNINVKNVKTALNNQSFENKANNKKENERTKYVKNDFNYLLEVESLEGREWKNWPKIDYKAFYGYTRDFVEKAVRRSEADPVAVLITFLTRFGVECGSNKYLYISDTKHFPRIFSVIVGPSAKARKGTSSQPVLRLFGEGFSTRHSPGPLSSGEGIVYHVRDAVGNWSVDTETGEKNWVEKDPGVEDKRLFILDEEFGSALSVMKREGNTLSSIIRTAWDSGTIEPLTKYNKIKTTNAHIGIVTHTNLVELLQKMNNEHAHSGFANRFLWCCARRQKMVAFPEPIPDYELNEMRDELIIKFKQIQKFNTLEYDNSFKTMWNDIYPHLAKDHPGYTGCIINRCEAQVIRLSMIYALLDVQNIIEKKHLESALALWKYCEDSAKFIFSKQSNPYSRRILASLKDGPKTATEIYRNTLGCNVKSGEIQEILTDLISQKLIEVENIKRKKGRPVTKFKIANGKRI